MNNVRFDCNEMSVYRLAALRVNEFICSEPFSTWFSTKWSDSSAHAVDVPIFELVPAVAQFELERGSIDFGGRSFVAHLSERRSLDVCYFETWFQSLSILETFDQIHTHLENLKGFYWSSRNDEATWRTNQARALKERTREFRLLVSCFYYDGVPPEKKGPSESLDSDSTTEPVTK